MRKRKKFPYIPLELPEIPPIADRAPPTFDCAIPSETDLPLERDSFVRFKADVKAPQI